MMAIFQPPRQQVTGALVDFSGVNQAVSKLGQALAQARERENMAKIGEAAQGGNLAAARDMAMKGGYLQQGMAFDSRIQQDRARAAAQARAKAQAEESRRRFELTHGLQQQQLDLRRQQLARGPKPTAAEAGYARAQQQGYKGTFLDYQKELRRAGAPQEEKAYDKAVGGQFGKTFLETQQTGAKANRAVNQLQVLDNALSDPNLYTGAGGPSVLALKRAAQAFGVKVKGVGSGELVSNISKKIALSFKDDLPGPLSNADRDFLVQMAPGLSNSPEGNRLIIRMGMLQRQYEIDRANAAREYASANDGRLDAGFFAVQSSLDQQYAGQFSSLMSDLRAQGEAAPKSPLTGFPRIQSLEEWRNLPSGTQYMDPQGNMRTKQ